MTKIVLELLNCTKCPHHVSTPYPTQDSFERPEYYWCKHPDHDNPAPESEGEERRVQIMERRDYKNLAYVAGYVEWNDKIPIPESCPIKFN